MCRLLNRFRWLVVPLVGVCSLAFPSSPVAAEDKPADIPEVVVKRRTETPDEALRKQLQNIPESGFDKIDLDGMYGYLTSAERQIEKPPADFGPRAFEMLSNRANRPEMAALPWLDSPKNELTKETADDLRTLGLKIRLVLDRSGRRGGQADLAGLRKLFSEKEWTSPKALPALTQILQIENADVRIVLVEALAVIKGEEASVALAQRAIFDLSPKVREKAVGALIGRPAVEYTPTLITALRYPWPVVADHAAEAVAALKRTDVVPTLVNLLKEPDPVLPVKTESGYSVKEVVRLNHLCNCVLCHAPSSNAKTDRVRGRIILTSEKPPERAYYGETTGTFVRADLTHLRQDFSVVQPVQNSGKWPDQQRYDYLVRTRMLTEAEKAAFEQLQKENKVPKSYPQQESVVFALRELTGKDFGMTYEGSQGLVKSEPQKANP